MTNTEHNSICECGNQAPTMADSEYSEYLKTYGNDCHLNCNECAIETLEDAGWLPEDFAKYTPDLAKIKQRQIANALLRLKRNYRKLGVTCGRLRHKIRLAERQIRLNEGNAFFKHKSALLAQGIDENKHILDEYISIKQQTVGILFSLIQLFDDYGKATPHEYAAILSTSHVHVEKALSMDDVTGLMHLIIYHVEDGANVGDFVSTGCVLHEVVSEVMIQEIMRNKELRESAHGFLNDWFVESTGRRLPMYALTTQPNGEQLLKRVPPSLSVVNQSKPIDARNSA